MVRERGDRAHHVLERQLVTILLSHQRALFVIVEHDRGEVEGQIVRPPLAIHRWRLERLDLRRRGRGRRWSLAGRGCFGRLRVLGGDLFQQRVLEQLLLHHFLELQGREL